MNPLRHEFIDQCRTTHTPTSSTASNRKLKYLDVGCGGGIFAESAARLPHVESVTGIDPSPLVLAVAKTHAQKDPTLYDNEKKLRYLNTSIEQLELPKSEEEGYDVLALWEVIEHVDYPTPFLEECIKHVRPGGWLVLSTIARTWTSWAVTKVVAEDIMRVVPRGTHDWSKYIQEKELRDWFARREGWGPTIAKGCVYVPGLGWRWVDGGEKWGNYFFAVRKPERIIHYEAV
jgi:polyprenyldihydroxybenzoate methyltransferase/3-demethylubiquinol 3-O-methyltransferase